MGLFVRKRHLHGIFLGIISYFALFGPRLIFADTMILTCLVLFACNYLYIASSGKIMKEYSSLILIFILLTFYSLLIFATSKINDIRFTFDLLKFFVYSGAAYLLVKMYRDVYGDEFEYKLNNHIFLIILVTAFVVIVLYFSESLRSFLSNYLELKMFSGGQVRKGERSIDLSMGGGTALSIIFFISVIQGYYLNKIRKDSFYIFKIGTIVFATLLTARTGFYLTVLYIFVLAGKKIYKSLGRGNLQIPKKINLKYLIFSLIIIGTTAGVLSRLDYTRFFNGVLPWALELFQGGGSTRSTNILSTHYSVLPKTAAELIFGSSDYKEEIDVGFLKIIFSVGLIGLGLILFSFLLIISKGLKKFSKGISSKLLLFLSLTIFLVNFKELVFLNSRTIFVLLMIFYFSISNKENHNIIKFS